MRVLDQVERPRLVCADTMNYWIASRRPQLLKVLARVDVLMVNDGEVRQLAGESNVVKAAQAAQRMGAKAVVVKRGEYGALLVTSEHNFFAPAFPLADVRDPTGAGDSFAGGFLGLLDRLDHRFVHGGRIQHRSSARPGSGASAAAFRGLPAARPLRRASRSCVLKRRFDRTLSGKCSSHRSTHKISRGLFQPVEMRPVGGAATSRKRAR